MVPETCYDMFLLKRGIEVVVVPLVRTVKLHCSGEHCVFLSGAKFLRNQLTKDFSKYAGNDGRAVLAPARKR